MDKVKGEGGGWGGVELVCFLVPVNKQEGGDSRETPWSQGGSCHVLSPYSLLNSVSVPQKVAKEVHHCF